MSDQRILDAFRRWGYLQAQIDPLGRLKPQFHPELDVTGEAADRSRSVYCRSIGLEFMHLPYPDRCRWIQERMESDAPEPDRGRILERLVSADTFERVLQSRYVGTKRYSLEGATALIPLLDEVLEGAAEHGAEELVLAMSHRGRLNVMVHILVIGFTATPSDLHSSRYASDMAKRLPIPIFHVNGEDPDAVVRAGRLAVEYRDAFWERRSGGSHRLPSSWPQRGRRRDHHPAGVVSEK